MKLIHLKSLPLKKYLNKYFSEISIAPFQAFEYQTNKDYRIRACEDHSNISSRISILCLLVTVYHISEIKSEQCHFGRVALFLKILEKIHDLYRESFMFHGRIY